uniref:Uncharacterized protein n=1 Tax=Magnetococcus massalia (strain MO-1) TaxID=451514 RepID=A0A1S7LHT7_MAGMO|nr:Exported protein of unknown function [Candidatus Magnetococcus massalia]
MQVIMAIQRLHLLCMGLLLLLVSSSPAQASCYFGEEFDRLWQAKAGSSNQTFKPQSATELSSMAKILDRWAVQSTLREKNPLEHCSSQERMSFWKKICQANSWHYRWQISLLIQQFKDALKQKNSFVEAYLLLQRRIGKLDQHALNFAAFKQPICSAERKRSQVLFASTLKRSLQLSCQTVRFKQLNTQLHELLRSLRVGTGTLEQRQQQYWSSKQLVQLDQKFPMREKLNAYIQARCGDGDKRRQLEQNFNKAVKQYNRYALEKRPTL